MESICCIVGGLVMLLSIVKVLLFSVHKLLILHCVYCGSCLLLYCCVALHCVW